MTLFDRTKEIAKQRGMNLQSVAEKAGLSKNTIYKWKDGQSPRIVTVKAVADVLGVSSEYLLGNTDEPTTKNVSNASQPAELSEILSDEGMAMFDGQPLSEEYKRALLAMLRANRGK